MTMRRAIVWPMCVVLTLSASSGVADDEDKIGVRAELLSMIKQKSILSPDNSIEGAVTIENSSDRVICSTGITLVPRFLDGELAFNAFESSGNSPGIQDGMILVDVIPPGERVTYRERYSILPLESVHFEIIGGDVNDGNRAAEEFRSKMRVGMFRVSMIVAINFCHKSNGKSNLDTYRSTITEIPSFRVENFEFTIPSTIYIKAQ